MEIKKTHIFMKYNPYTGKGASKFRITEVYECRIPSECLSTTANSVYFMKVGNTLEVITIKEFQQLENDTFEALKQM